MKKMAATAKRNELGECMDAVRKKAPLIHNITNYVTVNDVANMVLACGASPIMADDPAEAEEVTSICDGLNINIGTPSRRRAEAMLLAGKKARELGHVLLLDPVGAGVSAFRTNMALELMRTLKFDAVRGNISEIKTLAFEPGGMKENGHDSVQRNVLSVENGAVKGVDADVADTVTEDSLDQAVAFVKRFAREAGLIVAVSGAIDLVSDGTTCYVIYNGRPEMERITGTGCQLSGMMTAFLAANPDCRLRAAAAAVCAMGLAGEIGWSRMRDGDGNATYRSRIIDAIYHMDGAMLAQGANYEIR